MDEWLIAIAKKYHQDVAPHFHVIFSSERSLISRTLINLAFYSRGRPFMPIIDLLGARNGR